MTDTAVINIALQAMLISVKLAAPILVVTLGIGLAVSVFQSVTQIQEVTLTFVPKLAGVAVVLLVAGHWMLAQMVGFTKELFDLLPRLLSA
jgi:flagellar biosynthesis protein FliQ